ncbi:helix-turn-helix domain-containing protein, partial [Alkalihalophilus pseudofirmus]
PVLRSYQKPDSLSLRKNLDHLEKTLILNAMEQTGGNINQTAKLLEIPRQTLQYKLKKFSI